MFKAMDKQRQGKMGMGGGGYLDATSPPNSVDRKLGATEKSSANLCNWPKKWGRQGKIPYPFSPIPSLS
jgi:hypothetical protein